MKRFYQCLPLLLLVLAILTGCGPVGDKSASLTTIYGVTALLSLLIFLGYVGFVKQKDLWFVLLLASVLTVNCGYLYLALSTSLPHGLMANRISYLGSVMLPLSMFMIILRETGMVYKKRLPHLLFSISGVIFLIAASPGILPIYYKDVSFAVIAGAGTLVKVYGPLHPLYLFFLLGYFAAMIGAIYQALRKKSLRSPVHALILAMAVLVNIGVWLIEQLTSIDFEMLSVSYIISELFLLGLDLVANENRQLQIMVEDAKAAQKVAPAQPIPLPEDTEPLDSKQKDAFLTGLDLLTSTERKIYDAYIHRATTKEVMALLNITENTLKFHNKNLYSKLGVSSRKELLQIYNQISQ